MDFFRNFVGFFLLPWYRFFLTHSLSLSLSIAWVCMSFQFGNESYVSFCKEFGVGGRESVFVRISFYIHLVMFGVEKNSYSTGMFAYKMRFTRRKNGAQKNTYWIKCWIVIRMQCVFPSRISFSDVDRPCNENMKSCYAFFLEFRTERRCGSWNIMKKNPVSLFL